MTPFTFEPKSYTHLLGIPGLSDGLLKNHFTLYEGYVANVSKLSSLLSQTEPGTPEFSETRRRFGWEWNGMRLHELYFENLSKETSSLSPDSELGKIILHVWGSFENWKKDFLACGSMRGIGWVALVCDMDRQMVFNTWISEHDGGHLAGARPLLLLDVFEHAYMADYGLKKADYLETFFNHIDWNAVEGRLQ